MDTSKYYISISVHDPTPQYISGISNLDWTPPTSPTFSYSILSYFKATFCALTLLIIIQQAGLLALLLCCAWLCLPCLLAHLLMLGSLGLAELGLPACSLTCLCFAWLSFARPGLAWLAPLLLFALVWLGRLGPPSPHHHDKGAVSQAACLLCFTFLALLGCLL